MRCVHAKWHESLFHFLVRLHRLTAPVLRATEPNLTLEVYPRLVCFPAPEPPRLPCLHGSNSPGKEWRGVITECRCTGQRRVLLRLVGSMLQRKLRTRAAKGGMISSLGCQGRMSSCLNVIIQSRGWITFLSAALINPDFTSANEAANC